MLIKITHSGGHRYARLVQSFRNAGDQPRQRTIATLGRVGECGGQLDTLLAGLLRAKGRATGEGGAPRYASNPPWPLVTSGRWMHCGTSWASING